MSRIIASLLCSIFGSLFAHSVTHASSLQIQPTLYKDVVITKGEKSKGYVDISNPSATTQEVKLTVQRYKQIDDAGTLTFFDDEQISKGIKLDLDNFELGPRDAIRVYFQLDGTILPSGDIFAAIFAKTVPDDEMVAQAVQVGTLLSVTNGTPSSRTASITALSAPLVQWGSAVNATMVVKNTAPEGTTTGFFPKLKVDIQPFSSKTVDGPLVFAGRERTVEYTQKGNFFGIVRLTVQTEGDSANRWMFVVVGFWRWLAPLVLMAIILTIFFMLQQRRRTSKK